MFGDADKSAMLLEVQTRRSSPGLPLLNISFLTVSVHNPGNEKLLDLQICLV